MALFALGCVYKLPYDKEVVFNGIFPDNIYVCLLANWYCEPDGNKIYGI